MMKKMKAHRRGILKYILFVPTILAFTLMATATGENEKIINGKVYLESTEIPATGASVVIKGTTVGTVVDVKGEFSLSVTGNPELYISFVGFETKRVKANQIHNRPIIMVPSYFEIIPDENPVKNSSKKSITVRLTEEEGENSEMTVTFDQELNLKNNKDLIYVVDGDVSNSIEHIDPESIISISVIKDVDDPLVKRYNAEKGLLLITTKNVSASGESGEKEIIIEKEETEEFFFVVEDVPSFPGGRGALGEYINTNLEYPSAARAKQLAGKVMVSFSVETDGTLNNIRVTQSTNAVFNDAALQLFMSMPAWKPGKQRGKPVRTNVTVPVRFNPEEE